MAIRAAIAGALLGAAHLVQATPAYGVNYGNPYGGNGTGVVYTTEVVTQLTTYCPYATTLTYGSHTYTVTKPTTLTITDCPCTISKPVKPTAVTTPGVAYTTEVVTELTTYCPYATTLTYGSHTYTVTEPTTLTITDCPCTIRKPVKPTTAPPAYYTTEVLTAVTTYCSEATTLSFNNKTYSVTGPTTLTITDCPCTVRKPVYTQSGENTNVPVNPTGPAQTYATAPGSGATATEPVTVPTGAAERLVPGFLAAVLGAALLL